MKQQGKNRKLGRKKGPRTALLKSLMRSLVLRGKMTTTEAKAKEIRPLLEKMVTRGKSASLANRRLLIAALGDERAAGKLMKTAEGYQSRSGGYLRIVKLGARKGDAANMALIEFV